MTVSQLRADPAGFLLGELINDVRRSSSIQLQLKNDVAAIKHAVVNAGKSAVSKPMEARQNRRVSESRTDTVSPAGRSSADDPVNKVAKANAKPAVTPSVRTRDASGRFAGKSETDNQASIGRNKKGQFTSNGDGERQAEKVLFNGLADRISDAVSTSTTGLDDLDPTIRASREITEAVQPLARGYQAVFGGDKDKKSNWFGRIFKELRLSRKEDTTYNKASNKLLKSIGEKDYSGVDSGGALAGTIGGIASKVPAMIAGVFSGLGGVLLAGITGALGLIFSPIGLAIGVASAAAWGLFTEQGQKFFGEVGAKIIEGWNVVVTAFAPITESIGAGWETVKGGFDVLIDGMVSSWDAFTGFLKDKFGIDLPAIFKPVAEVGKKVIDGAKSVVSGSIDAVKSKASKVTDAVVKSSPKTAETAGRAWNKIKEGAGSITDKITEGAGKISSNATGKTAANKSAMIAEMDAQGIVDPKERAMLMAEVDHESGGFTKTKENTHYRSADRLMQLSKTARGKGKPAVEAAIAQGDDAVAELMYGGRMGNTEKGDGAKYKGRGLIQLTGKDNYAAASKDLGIDLVNHPELAESPDVAAKTAAWYWKKNNLGESARRGDVKANRHGTNGGENGINDVQNKYDRYLAEANKGALTAGTPASKTEVASLAVPIISNVAPAQSASMPSPSVPKMPLPLIAAEAPPVVTPMSSDSGRQSISVTVDHGEVGQNLSDRRIAHVQMGGIAGV
jgi:predicted chitinase